MFALRSDSLVKNAERSLQLMPQAPHIHESREMSNGGNWQFASVWQTFQSAGTASFLNLRSSTNDCQTCWKSASERGVARQFIAQRVENLLDIRRGDRLEIGFVALLQLDAESAADFDQSRLALLHARRLGQRLVGENRQDDAFAIGMAEKRIPLGERMGCGFDGVAHDSSFGLKRRLHTLICITLIPK